MRIAPSITRPQRLITLGVMFSLFMAAMETTVVATAMPTIVAHLGGLDVYSWVFSAYLVASTTVVPVVGKLSDAVGRKPLWAGAMALFLAGSVLCGQATSMGALIGFRVVQGLGAGGIMTLSFIIVGALFSFEQRARMQGVFASVWGFASIVGPLLGGFLVDQVSWRWIFYINVLPGLAATALIWTVWVDERRAAGGPPIDYAGFGVLTATVLALLLGLFQLRAPAGAALVAGAAGLLAALVWIERRAADPVLPVRLFRDRLFTVAVGHGFLSGVALFGSFAFVPLFVQAVLGTTATGAGATITPIMLGWVLAAIVGSRLLLRLHYRTLALAGMASLSAGALLMTAVDAGASRAALAANLALMGIGMGLSVPTLLIAVQTTAPRADLGTATSMLQFSRSVGGAVGVSVMGVVLSARLAGILRSAGVDAAAVSLDRLMDPLSRSAATTGTLDALLRQALAGGVRAVFVISAAAALAALAAVALAPKVGLAQAIQRAQRTR
ncbi:MAG: MDR family MFS transporter [Armatimonadota bacterium]|nr:MDR family MFS transporter [Armatimonadota bacterium]